MIQNRFITFILLLAGMALLSACSPAAPEPTITPMPATATETAVPSATPAPTETPVPPTDTALPTDTPEPTATDTAEPTATSTATATETPTATFAPRGMAYPYDTSVSDPMYLYLIQQYSGGAICGDSAIGLSAGFSRTNDVSKDVKQALQNLFALSSEYVSGFYNPVSFSNLKVENVKFNRDNGLITVNLRGTYIPTGDDCDNSRVKAQIWSVIRQRREVKMTNIYLNGGPFGDKVSNDK